MGAAMNGAFKNNPLALILGGTCLGLIAISAAVAVFSGGMPEVDQQSVAQQQAQPAEAAGQFELKPLNQYAHINERPLFNQDRRPVVEVEAPAQDPVNTGAPSAPPLKAQLAGVVITPDARIAMVRDIENKQLLSVAEGEGFEGGLAGWRVDKVEPKLAVLRSDDGQTKELELHTYQRSLSVPAAPAKPAARNNARRNQQNDNEAPAKAEETDNQGLTRAEEIRRRIAERRAQLREQAEERAQQDDNN